ncbi:hypothetical protein [Aquimarina sp. MMG016]|uniref:hypothetical protein n=1 Tax=Aquimarina sp. MMG016 TaxID=2822690 RepID=UPI001B39CF0F|nr:hypothetical protein [Aquimarina sp. MMG016]MBQ4822468.1 hypothetical protein [Aquimarina sp. MMG016]
MNKRILFLTLFLMTTLASAQRIKMDKKKLQFLKGETKIGVELTFPGDFKIQGFSLFLPEPGFEIRGGKTSEKVFIEKMRKKWGKNDAALGERWVQHYKEAKQKQWQELFLKTVNEGLQEYTDLRFTSSDEDANYKLIVEADWMYFGYGKVQVARNGAKLITTLKFVKVSDPETVIYETTTPNILGSYIKGEFGDIVRMGNCYDKLGHLLEIQLKRILK